MSATEVVGDSSPALAIVDLTTATDTITLVDSLAIADARVGVDITHTWIADLDIDLISPAATTVRLMEDNGGSADDVLVSFSVQGNPFDAADLRNGLGYQMQPFGPGSMFDFVGEDTAGDWTLSIADGAGGDTGTLNFWDLELGDVPAPPPPPVNDLCAAAIAVTSGSTTAFDSTSATVSGADAGCSGTAPIDVWYSLLVPCDGDYTVDTCGSSFDTTLTIWTGDCGALAVVDCNNDSCATGSEVVLSGALAGTLYSIQIGGNAGDAGAGVLNIGSAAAPVNDLCIDAIDAPTAGASVTFSTACASADGIVPGCGGGAEPIDIWYRVTADCTGQITISTDGSDFDTRIAVWPDTGCPVAGDTPLYCDDDGGAGLQSLIIIPGVNPGETFLLQVAGYAAGTGTGGVLTVDCDLAPVVPVDGLACTPDISGDVIATWSNPAVYDEIVIYLDGAVDQTLGGTETTATVGGLAALSSHEICVEAVASGTLPVQQCCSVTVPGDSTGMHIIVQGEEPSDVDSVAALQSALPMATNVVASVSEVLGTPASIWLCMGTYPDNSALSAAEGQVLHDLVIAGVPVWISGGDVWGFDAPTAFNTVDGVHGDIDDGATDDHDGMVGADLLDGFASTYTHDQAGADWIDRLVVADPGEDELGDDMRIILSDDLSGGSAGYDTGVAYYTNSGGPVICVSSEFGGVNGDQDGLAQSYVDFLLNGVIVPSGSFRRGDSNGDGSFDISDAVFTLAALFTFGADAPACYDASDANDDGNHDISDAVYTLAALFTPGAPAIPAPGASDCGSDATSDPLDCVDYSACD